MVMAIGFMVLMPEGVVAYRNTLLLDALSPIMQHGTKAKKRTIHMTLQVSMGFQGEVEAVHKWGRIWPGSIEESMQERLRKAMH